MFKRFGVLLLILSLAAFSLIGCGASGETPEQAVSNALTALRDLDHDKMEQYIVFDELIDDAEEMAEDEEFEKLLFNRLSFDIISSSEDGDTATVSTEISNIDMVEILGQYFIEVFELAFSNAFSEDPLSEEELDELIEEMLIEMLQDDGAVMATTTVDIKLVKSDSTWKIQIDEMFQDAVLGGLLTAIQELDEIE